MSTLSKSLNISRTVMFEAVIRDGQLEAAIDLPGWSHAGPVFKQRCLWYPFEDYFRRIYFKAKNRTEACRQCDRVGLLVRDLVKVGW